MSFAWVLVCALVVWLVLACAILALLRSGAKWSERQSNLLREQRKAR